MKSIVNEVFPCHISTMCSDAAEQPLFRWVMQPNPNLKVFDVAGQIMTKRGTSSPEWTTIGATTTDIPVSAEPHEVNEFIAGLWDGLREKLATITVDEAYKVAQLLPIPAIPMPTKPPRTLNDFLDILFERIDNMRRTYSSKSSVRSITAKLIQELVPDIQTAIEVLSGENCGDYVKYSLAEGHEDDIITKAFTVILDHFDEVLDYCYDGSPLDDDDFYIAMATEDDDDDDDDEEEVAAGDFTGGNVADALDNMFGGDGD